MVVDSVYKIRSLLQKSIPNSEISAVFKQMSIMLDSGVGLLECMQYLKTRNVYLESALKDIVLSLQEGLALYECFLRHSDVFGNLACVLLQLGQTSGNLKLVTHTLAQHFALKAELSSQIKKALVYPIVVLCSMVLAFVAIIYFVLPAFLELFGELGVELPVWTNILLWAHDLFELFGIFWVGVVFGIIVSIRMMYKNLPDFALRLDGIILHMPLIGELTRLRDSYNFCFGLSNMLKGALPLERSLVLAIDSVQNKALRMQYQKLPILLYNAKPLSFALETLGLLDSVNLALVSVGEKSAQLAEMFEIIARNTENLTKEKIDIALRLLEPTLSIAMGSMILLLALGVFVPMWDLSSSALNF